MIFCSLSLFITLLFPRVADCQFASVTPRVVPLAVRSPYLNVWTWARNGTGFPNSAPSGDWPKTWAQHISGWAGYVRVDGQSYQWQGSQANFNLTDRVSNYLSPTRTIFTLNAGPMQLNLTYLSPVEPSDWVRQSFPFSYLAIDVKSMDGQPHIVQLYSDITGELLSDDLSEKVRWDTAETPSVVIHSMYKVTPSLYSERDDIPQDGTLYFAMPTKSPKLTWQSGDSLALRYGFKENGFLNNTRDADFRSIGLNTDWPVIALSTDLGSILETSSPVVWAVGFVREPTIRTRTVNLQANGIETAEIRSLYFWTKYSDIDDAINDFLVDFQHATDRANALDNQLMGEASAISSQYADLIALSLRQTFASMDITVPTSDKRNSSNIKAYMKDLGNSRRINAVDTIYSALPSLLYLNSTLVRLLLEPLLEFQNGLLYDKTYAAADLGTTYPDVKGNHAVQQINLAVENCGTMLVMVLAHAQKSGDGSLIQRYYSLLKTWAEYLVANNFDPSGLGESNLSLNGIAGILAMSSISRVLQNTTDAQHYASVAQNYMQRWQDLAFSVDHVTSTYGDSTSWNLLYSSYSQSLLNISFISDTLLNAQAAFYAGKMSGAAPFGFPSESGVMQSRSDWTIFTAAAMPDSRLRDNMISSLHAFAFLNNSGDPWATEFDSENGSVINGRGSPAQGAAFALLAESILDKPIQLSPTATMTSRPDSTPSRDNKAVIAGGVVGGLAFLAIIAGTLTWYLRKHRANSKKATPFVGSARNTSLTPRLSQTMSQENTSPMSKAQRMDAAFHGARPLAVLHPLRRGQIPQGETQAGASLSSSQAIRTNTSSDQDNSVLRYEVEELRRELVALQEVQQMQLELPPTYIGNAD